MVQINFNANDVAPAKGFDLLPSGDYLAVVEDSQEKANRAGTGSYLEFTFMIVEGQHEGRKQWSRLNIKNASPKAEEIAKAELSALCRAVGVLEMTDTGELHSKPLRIKVSTEKGQDGVVRNVVKGFMAAVTVGAGAPASKSAGVQPPAWLAK